MFLGRVYHTDFTDFQWGYHLKSLPTTLSWSPRFLLIVGLMIKFWECDLVGHDGDLLSWLSGFFTPFVSPIFRLAKKVRVFGRGYYKVVIMRNNKMGYAGVFVNLVTPGKFNGWKKYAWDNRWELSPFLKRECANIFWGLSRCDSRVRQMG